jgi:hypothetical protein
MPDTLSIGSPGAMYLGALATQTARNAKRQQVPTATAADLRVYWEQLSAGDNWLRSQMPPLN